MSLIRPRCALGAPKSISQISWLACTGRNTRMFWISAGVAAVAKKRLHPKRVEPKIEGHNPNLSLSDEIRREVHFVRRNIN